MKTRITLALFLALGSYAWGQQAPQTPAPATAASSKPPSIPESQKTAYWRALAKQEKDARWAEKNTPIDDAAVRKALEDMLASCGANYELQAPNDELQCVAKPAKEAK